MIRSSLIVVVTLIGLFILPASLTAGVIPKRPSREQTLRVNELIESATTKSELVDRLGVSSQRCIRSSNQVELCEWELSNRDSAWRDLARAVDTSKRVVVICALPIDDGLRLQSSCVARPRQSNRNDFRTSNIKRARGVKRAEVREIYQRIAQGWIDEALTMVSMSFLLGSVPYGCESPRDGNRVCVWRLDNADFGHGTVVTALGVRAGLKVRLRCELPIDGSPRADGSCEAMVDR